MTPTYVIDPYLVARVQASATGAYVHDVCRLLGCYYEVTRLANEDPVFGERFEAIERRLRAFCQTGQLPRAA